MTSKKIAKKIATLNAPDLNTNLVTVSYTHLTLPTIYSV